MAHAASDRGRGRTDPDDVDVERLELLGDEYARAVLRAVVEEPRSGNEVATAASVSKTTAFRRLNRLEAVGLVESEHALDPEEGHHHKRFRATVDALVVEVTDEGFDVAVVDAADDQEGAEGGTGRLEREWIATEP